MISLVRGVASIALLVWLATGTAFSGPDTATTFEVLRYSIQVQPDFDRKMIHGSETIHFKSLVNGLESISFSAGAAEVTAPWIERSNGRTGTVDTMITSGRRVFRLPAPMARGEAARITFTFESGAKGAVFNRSATEVNGITSRSNTVYANYFTCDVLICDQDRTSDKATIDFQLRLPPGMQAVGPGRPYSYEDTAGEGNIWGWTETRPTSAYLMGFAAGDFHRVQLPGHGPRLIVLAQEGTERQAQSMFRDTRRMLSFFEAKSGVRYDASHYTQVLVVGDEAQEAARHAIIGRENIEPILTDPKEDWVIAHELAHQWWGNSLTCADWSELWLNEGFAVFMTAAYKEHRWGRAAYDRELELANKRWAAAKEQGFDVPLSWKGEYPSLKLKRAMAYAKAVVFIDTLRKDLGERAFWRAIKSYTRKHKDGVVTASDLQHAFEDVSGRNLSPLFDEWVFGPPQN